MAKEKKKGKGAPSNNTGRPTGSYSSYATSGYGNSYGYGAGGRSPYGTYAGSPASQVNPANSTNANNSKVEKVNLSDTGKSKGKQKKLAKKAAKFDETDLRCYPMTVGGWIGTFILLAIPLIGFICGICWFFGVGNKSRTSWIRSYVVILLLIVLFFGIVFGVGYSLLAKNAKNDGYEGMNGTVYYAACKVIDMFGDMIGDAETVEGIKDMLAEKLGLKSADNGDGTIEGEGTVEGGGTIEGGGSIEGDGEDDPFDEE